MNWFLIAVGVLLVLACGVSGSLALLYRARRMRLREQAYGLSTPYLPHIAAVIGGLSGLLIGGLLAYYLSLNQQGNPIEWIGRFSYVLVAWAGGGHLLYLVHIGLQLWREEGDWQRGDEKRQSLGRRRRIILRQLRQQHRHYIDLKARDDVVIDELIGVLGNPLLNVRRDLSRIPLYGYLGTVCGILLMAQNLSRIDEATQTFKVLGSMAEGLALAFQTTLVALLTYLPLRKAADYLVQRVGALEDSWAHLRDEEGVDV
ncbi:MAG: hypothetical protein HOC74_22255 [Gemmatimonadetes bacterium]|nr:hypothetical protein [Gemmatimonadota bacterium]